MEKLLTKDDILTMDEMIFNHYKQYKDEDKWTVFDGIVDLDTYNQSKYKILWILKEVHDDSEKDDPSEEYHEDIRTFLKDHLRDGNKFKKGWGGTFKAIVYTTFGILNNCLWDDMDDIEKDPTMIDVIKSIAYINIKKEPGTSKANPKEIEERYYRDEAVILHQINKFAPDIIICGGTLLDYLIKGLGLKEEESKRFGDLKCYIKNDKIYIRTYHPGFYGNKEEYVNGIIKAIRSWKNI